MKTGIRRNRFDEKFDEELDKELDGERTEKEWKMENGGILLCCPLVNGLYEGEAEEVCKCFYDIDHLSFFQ